MHWFGKKNEEKKAAMHAGEALPQIQLVTAALIAAQKNFAELNRNASNDELERGYHYADLAEIIRATRDALAAQGLIVVQPIESNGNGSSFVRTCLIHTSGQFLQGRIELPKTSDMQRFGSAATYARRYGMQSILGIAADRDDDGNASREPKTETIEDKRAEAEATERRIQQDRKAREQARKARGVPAGTVVGEVALHGVDSIALGEAPLPGEPIDPAPETPSPEAVDAASQAWTLWLVKFGKQLEACGSSRAVDQLVAAKRVELGELEKNWPKHYADATSAIAVRRSTLPTQQQRVDQLVASATGEQS